MVMNIPRSEATALGQDLGQESIIWGRREEDEEGGGDFGGGEPEGGEPEGGEEEEEQIQIDSKTRR